MKSLRHFPMNCSNRDARGLILLAVIAGSGCQGDDVAGPVTPTRTDAVAAQLLGLPGIATFSTYLGGKGQDQVRDVALDAAGNMYVVGGTMSSNFPTTAGAFDRSYNGNFDIFVAKFSPTGSLLFSTFLGGPHYDRAYAVELDPSGNIIIGGRSGGGLPGTAGKFNPTFKGGKLAGVYGPQDGFVCKLNPTASAVIFCGYIGTLDEHITRDVAVDSAGNIYATYLADQAGISASWTAGGYIPTFPGSSTNLIVKIAPDGGSILAGTWFGGSGEEGGNPSLRWFNGNVYFAGHTASADLPTPGGFDQSLGGTWDDFLAVFTDNLQSLVFATYVGGSNVEDVETHNLAIDAGGNAFIASNTASTDLPGTAGKFQATNSGGNDAFVMKISPTGALLASSYYGGTLGDQFQGVAVDNTGRVFLSTISQSLVLPTTAGTLGMLKNGSAGLVVMSPDLDSLLFAEFLGGSLSDEARNIAVGAGGIVVMGGMTQSSNWYLASSYQSGFGGGTMDGILMRFTGF
jgi:hypothetical protein